MPVKKTKKKKATKKVKAEIKQAVEKMPGLIFEHVRIETPEPKPAVSTEDLYPQTYFNETPESTPQKNKRLNTPDYNEMDRRKRFMWLAVVIMALIVFGMWGLNMFANLRDMRDGWVEPKTGIIDTAKNEWNKAMKADEVESSKQASPDAPAAIETTEPVEKTIDLESVKNEIKNNLIGILSTLSTSTASSTNTQNYGQASTTTSSTN